MHTYWNLEPKARAALSANDVERYIDAELMMKGVLKVEPPIYDDEPPLPDLEFATWYKVGGHAPVFPSAEAALKFIDLGPRETETKYLGDDWRSREKLEYLNDDRTTGEILPIKVLTEAQLTAQKSALDKRGEAITSNRKKRDEYEFALKATKDALEGLWSDWYARRAEAAKHRKVVDTYEAYSKTAGGDTKVAAKFLLKVFSAEEIRDAATWFDTTIMTDFPPELEPSAPEPPSAPAEEPMF